MYVTSVEEQLFLQISYNFLRYSLPEKSVELIFLRNTAQVNITQRPMGSFTPLWAGSKMESSFSKHHHHQLFLVDGLGYENMLFTGQSVHTPGPVGSFSSAIVFFSQIRVCVNNVRSRKLITIFIPGRTYET